MRPFPRLIVVTSGTAHYNITATSYCHNSIISWWRSRVSEACLSLLIRKTHSPLTLRRAIQRSNKSLSSPLDKKPASTGKTCPTKSNFIRFLLDIEIKKAFLIKLNKNRRRSFPFGQWLTCWCMNRVRYACIIKDTWSILWSIYRNNY